MSVSERPRKPRVRLAWLRVREETNALDYLNQAHYFITLTPHDRLAWKWVIIALHGAVYSFAVCTSKGTDYTNVTVGGNGRKLIGFDDAVARCKQRVYLASKPLATTPAQDKSITKLKQLRNKFLHYIPTAWSIEMHGLPQIAVDVLDVIRFMVVDTGATFHFNRSQMKQFKSLIHQSKRILKKNILYSDITSLEKYESAKNRKATAVSPQAG
jgi:hypothetical protein